MSAADKQVGGGHYSQMLIQPAEYCELNGLSPLEAKAIKYVSRHRSKNGVQDLQKAIHCLELLIHLHYEREDAVEEICDRLRRSVGRGIAQAPAAPPRSPGFP